MHHTIAIPVKVGHIELQIFNLQVIAIFQIPEPHYIVNYGYIIAITVQLSVLETVNQVVFMRATTIQAFGINVYDLCFEKDNSVIVFMHGAACKSLNIICFSIRIQSS